MDRWMNKLIYGWVIGGWFGLWVGQLMDRWTEKLMEDGLRSWFVSMTCYQYGYVDGQMDEWIDESMDRQHGLMNGQVGFSHLSKKVFTFQTLP